jgi:hypothetical protein
MGKRQTFASVAWAAKEKVMRRERFLAKMDTVTPFHKRFHVDSRVPLRDRGNRGNRRSFINNFCSMICINEDCALLNAPTDSIRLGST